MEALQPANPPSWRELVGKRIEICWPYRSTAAEDLGALKKIWSEGEVKAIADGSKRRVEGGMCVLFAWDGDPTRLGDDGKPDPTIEPPGEQWRPLLDSKWKRHVQYGWRLALSEVAPERATADAAARAPTFDYESEEEYLPSDDEDEDEDEPLRARAERRGVA